MSSITEIWTIPDSKGIQVFCKIFLENSDTYFLEKYLHKEASKASPGVATLYDKLPYNNEDFLVIYVEFCPRGSLRQCVNQLKNDGSRLSAEELYQFSVRMVETVSQIHVARIAHRRISLEHWVLDKENKPKLIHFGMAKLVQECTTLDNHTLVSDLCCRSPEISLEAPTLSQTLLDVFKEDVWSLGTVIYELATCEEWPVFSVDQSEEARHLIQNRLTERGYPQLIPALSGMLECKYRDRLTASEAFEKLQATQSNTNLNETSTYSFDSLHLKPTLEPTPSA